MAAAYGAVLSLPEYDDGELEQAARQVADEGADLAKAAGLDAQASSPRAPTRAPGTRSSKPARARRAVIVIGARGLSTFKSVLLGSVSHGVAQHAHVPVLIVPPPTADRRRQARAALCTGGVHSATGVHGPGSCHRPSAPRPGRARPAPASRGP